MLALTLIAVLAAGGDEAPSDAPYVYEGPPVESMSRLELRQEYARIEEVRPGIGLPITMMSVGGGLVGYGTILLLSSASSFGGTSSLFANGNVTGYLFVAMIATGLGLLAPGIWLVVTRRDERKVLGDRMDAITERLQQLDRADDYARERRQPYRAPDALPPPPPGYQL